MTISSAARRVLRILDESGPRNLNLVRAIAERKTRVDSPNVDYVRVVGELFVDGSVVWIGTKKGRRLAAVSYLKREGAN